MPRIKRLATAFAAAVMLAACGSGEPSAPETCEPEGTSVKVVASEGQFTSACVAVPADQRFTVTFSNEDAPGAHHNFTVRDGGESVLVIVAGSGESSTEEGAPMKAGIYQFLCTIHPLMKGTFMAAAPQNAS